VVEQSSLNEETGGEVRKTLCLFSSLCGEWACPLTTEYPFIKHIPIAIVMSISHISGCATICGKIGNEISPNLFLVFGFPFLQGAMNSRLSVSGGSRYGDDRQ